MLNILRQLIATPFGLLMALVYALALITLLYQQDWKGLALVGGIFAITFLLIPLLLKLSNREETPAPLISRPWVGLAVWVPLLVIQLWTETTAPRWVVGGYEINSVLMKLLLLVVLPLLLFRVQGYSWHDLGFRLGYWQTDLKVALILGGVVLMAVLGLSFLFLNISQLQRLGSIEMLPRVLWAFIYFVFKSGLPEEFFFRTYLQEHLNAVLKSRWSGLALAALIFGLLHMLHWKLKGAPFLTAFAYAALGQMSVGLLFCLLWERLRSLIPVVLLHGWLNAVAITSGLAGVPLT